MKTLLRTFCNVFITSYILCSCTTIDLYEKAVTIPKHQWSSSFKPSFDLTIKDTTKPVKLSVEYSGIAKDPWGNVKAGFTISGKINRKDWGVNYNAVLETGGVMLGEELKIHGEIQLVKQVVAVAA